MAYVQGLPKGHCDRLIAIFELPGHQVKLVTVFNKNGVQIMEYNLFADMLNKYSQLTPWVQALIGLGAFSAILGIAYFFKETVAVIMRPFQRTQHQEEPKEAKPEWRDKYYRDENAK